MARLVPAVWGSDPRTALFPASPIATMSGTINTHPMSTVFVEMHHRMWHEPALSRIEAQRRHLLPPYHVTYQTTPIFQCPIHYKGRGQHLSDTECSHVPMGGPSPSKSAPGDRDRIGAWIVHLGLAHTINSPLRGPQIPIPYFNQVRVHEDGHKCVVSVREVSSATVVTLRARESAGQKGSQISNSK